MGLGQRRAALIIAGCFSADVTGNIWSAGEEKQPSRPRCLNNGEDFSSRAFPGIILLYIWPCHAACGRVAGRACAERPGLPSAARYLAADAHSVVIKKEKRGSLGRGSSAEAQRASPLFPDSARRSRPPTQPLGGVLIPQSAPHGIALLRPPIQFWPLLHFYFTRH